MKMTKQIKTAVNAVNVYLRNNHIKEEADPVFSITTYALIDAGCYHGFNYFTEDGRLSGGLNENFDHLELYII